MSLNYLTPCVRAEKLVIYERIISQPLNPKSFKLTNYIYVCVCVCVCILLFTTTVWYCRGWIFIFSCYLSRHAPYKLQAIEGFLSFENHFTFFSLSLSNLSCSSYSFARPCILLTLLTVSSIRLKWDTFERLACNMSKIKISSVKWKRCTSSRIQNEIDLEFKARHILA